MSNNNLSSKKIIQIKPSHYFYKEEPADNMLSVKMDEVEKVQHELLELSNQKEQLKRQKEQLIQSTKAEIEMEKENWQKEKLNLVELAKEEGYTAGFSSGKEESLEQYKKLIEQANSIIKTATDDYHATIDKSDETIIKLAIHTAEKVLTEKISEEPASFLNIVKQAIKELQDQSVISIYLHPVNYEYVVEQKEELARILPNDMRLALYVKEDLPENSCIIEHPFGQIDASVDTQLKQIYDILLEVAQES